MPASRLYVPEELAKRARGSVRLHDAGARAGVKLYEIVAPELEGKRHGKRSVQAGCGGITAIAAKEIGTVARDGRECEGRIQSQ